MIDIKDAIEVARILSKAPQERLRMLLSVFEAADLTVEGLEELEALAVSKDKNNIVDIREFMDDIEKHFAERKHGGEYHVPVAAFIEYCEKNGIDPRAVKPCLARRGVLKTFKSERGVQYTSAQRIDGRVTRCVVLKEVDHAQSKSERDPDGEGVQTPEGCHEAGE